MEIGPVTPTVKVTLWIIRHGKLPVSSSDAGILSALLGTNCAALLGRGEVYAGYSLFKEIE